MDSGEAHRSPTNPQSLYFYLGARHGLWTPCVLTHPLALVLPAPSCAAADLLAVSPWACDRPCYLSTDTEPLVLHLLGENSFSLSVPPLCHRHLHFVPETCKSSLVPLPSPATPTPLPSPVDSTSQLYPESMHGPRLYPHCHHPSLSLHHLLPVQQS